MQNDITQIEIDFDEFAEDMQRYEELFPNVRLIVEIVEEHTKEVFRVDIAHNIKKFDTYEEVKDYIESFKDKDLPKDPQVIIDKEKQIKFNQII